MPPGISNVQKQILIFYKFESAYEIQICDILIGHTEISIRYTMMKHTVGNLTLCYYFFKTTIKYEINLKHI